MWEVGGGNKIKKLQVITEPLQFFFLDFIREQLQFFTVIKKKLQVFTDILALLFTLHGRNFLFSYCLIQY